MKFGHDLWGDRFDRVINHAFATLRERGVAGIPEFPLIGLDKGMDRKVVYCDRLIQHCEHIASRCDEIVYLLDMMSTTRDKLQSLEAEFDRLGSLVVSDDPETADRAIQDYNWTLNSKIDMRAGLRGVLSEAITVKFASISYTLFPVENGGGVRVEIGRRHRMLKDLEKSVGLSASDKSGLENLERVKKAERPLWLAIRERRGKDLVALFAPLIDGVMPYLDRDARDQIVHFDERIDTNETRSEHISFADLSPAELAILRGQMAQLSADSKAVSAGIWRFQNKLRRA